ncbi:hypothetical protein FOA52_004317 [Chlamydomonas sp. UWO 241]|nr:hypothetical protein FOA52_004317 [Chlamydomonas sp. UWO 241]
MQSSAALVLSSIADPVRRYSGQMVGRGGVGAYACGRANLHTPRTGALLLALLLALVGCSRPAAAASCRPVYAWSAAPTGLPLLGRTRHAAAHACLSLLIQQLLASTRHAHGHSDHAQGAEKHAGTGVWHWQSTPIMETAPSPLVGPAVVAPPPDRVHTSRALLLTCTDWKWSWVTSSYVVVGETAACTKVGGSACTSTCHGQCCPDDGNCVGVCSWGQNANLSCASAGAGSVVTGAECPMNGYHAFCDFGQHSPNGSGLLGRVRCTDGAGLVP